MAERLIIGFAGGFAAELVGVWEERFKASVDRPAHLKSWFYWGMVAIMSAFGAGLVHLYEGSGDTITPILALNIGASASLILRQLTRAAPDIKPGSTG